MQIQYSAAKTTDELQQILLLQKENFRHKNDVEEEEAGGPCRTQLYFGFRCLHRCRS